MLRPPPCSIFELRRFEFGGDIDEPNPTAAVSAAATREGWNVAPHLTPVEAQVEIHVRGPSSGVFPAIPRPDLRASMSSSSSGVGLLAKSEHAPPRERGESRSCRDDIAASSAAARETAFSCGRRGRSGRTVRRRRPRRACRRRVGGRRTFGDRLPFGARPGRRRRKTLRWAIQPATGIRKANATRCTGYSVLLAPPQRRHKSPPVDPRARPIRKTEPFELPWTSWIRRKTVFLERSKWMSGIGRRVHFRCPHVPPGDDGPRTSLDVFFLRLGLFDDDQRDHQVNAKHRRRSFHNPSLNQ